MKPPSTGSSAASAPRAAAPRAPLAAAREQAAAAGRAYAQAQEKPQKYPAPDKLAALRQTLLTLSEQADAPLPDAPAKPGCPPVFQEVAAGALMDKAQRDGREFDPHTPK